MKKFQVSVNGKVYEVEVEEVGGAAVSAPVAAAPVAATLVAVPPAPAPAASNIPENATKVVAPMPGKIVDVKVSMGQEVKEGDLVAILEAMKMENEVFASAGGKITSINVSSGESVESNDVIVTIA